MSVPALAAILPLLLAGCDETEGAKRGAAPPGGNPARAVADVDAARAEADRPVVEYQPLP